MNEMTLFEQKGETVTTEIKIMDNNGIQAVSARELYKRLEITERFSSWFERVCSYGFEENSDYSGCKIFNTLAKQELQDYEISIEMAKQICMLQRTELGKKYREYFLKLEKAWNTPEAIMARALQVANRTLEEVTKRALVAESALDRIANGKGCFTMNQTAKALKLPYGNKTLFAKLREMNILNSDNSPKQEQVNGGHFKVIVKSVSNIGNVPVTLTTGKGLVYLAKRFNTKIDENVKADA